MAKKTKRNRSTREVTVTTETHQTTRVMIGGKMMDYIDIYQLASELSYEIGKFGFENLMSLVEVAKAITPRDKRTLFLDQAVRELIMRNFMNSFPIEFDIHDLAKRNIHKVVSNCKLINRHQ